jgi:dCMP deaminase
VADGSIPDTAARPDWNTYFLDIADAVARRSDCQRAKVGAVIVDRRRRIVSTGYVGTASGEQGCLDGACPRGQLTQAECATGTVYTNCISFHAEVNALLYSDRSRHEHGLIYVTREPCHWCYKLIKAAGIAAAIWGNATPDSYGFTPMQPWQAAPGA